MIPDRHSWYNGHELQAPVIGFHRVKWDIITAHGRKEKDWKNNGEQDKDSEANIVFYPSNTIAEGFMRNGINDSNHRGVWFYLAFEIPNLADANDVVVELHVGQSSIHKGGKCKWHMKYCAADDRPGFENQWTRVRALHVPFELLTDEFIQELM